MAEIDVEFQRIVDLYLESIKSKVEELFKEAVQISIYDKYTPKQYHRNYTFLNSIKAHVNPEGNIYVYVDLNEGSQYYSTVDGSSQFSNVGNYLEYGHHDSTGISGAYHSYEKRNYLEKAYELIHNEFPELNIQIIK